jgi:hypothetical protein
MIKPSLQNRAVSFALGRLLELDRQLVSASPGSPAFRADNAEVIRLLRLAFPEVRPCAVVPIVAPLAGRQGR